MRVISVVIKIEAFFCLFVSLHIVTNIHIMRLSCHSFHFIICHSYDKGEKKILLLINSIIAYYITKTYAYIRACVHSEH